MIKRSATIYLTGFLFGLIICTIIFIAFPSIYLFFIELLRKKVEVQGAAIKSLPLMIILNNIIAASVCAFGGYSLSKAYLFLDSGNSSDFIKRFKTFDRRIAVIPQENLKYYISLYTIPVFVLFLNGFVLGAFFILYAEDMGRYFTNLLPHGYFEIPGIIIAGSIGLEIADRGTSSLKEIDKFKTKINTFAKDKIMLYLLVILLLIIGGVFETYFM